MNLEEGDIVLCTVDRITGTSVFVNIEGDGEGSIIFSEIAPGRIRNIRDYVVPKKKIVCKILRISGNQINLSLRRVIQKEKKEIMDKFAQEKSYKSILKTILKENAEEVIKEIIKIDNLYDFMEEAKEESKNLEKIAGKEQTKKILEIINKQRQKKAIIQKEFSLKMNNQNGISIIKKILDVKNAEIRYISAGKYFIRVESKDLKSANTEINQILECIEKSAKKERGEFKIKEK